jgi:hypothetical protein
LGDGLYPVCVVGLVDLLGFIDLVGSLIDLVRQIEFVQLIELIAFLDLLFFSDDRLDRRFDVSDGIVDEIGRRPLRVSHNRYLPNQALITTNDTVSRVT